MSKGGSSGAGAVWVAVVLASLLSAAALAPKQAEARQFLTGFEDASFEDLDPEVRQLWAGRAARINARVIRIDIKWADVAPAVRPTGFVAADPTAKGYRWAAVDGAVRVAADRRMKAFITVQRAPVWAERPGRPATVKPGRWKPDPRQFGRFARALALRYSGSFPDPERPGRSLPRVGHFEAWNEPNLTEFLAPQWQGERQVGVELYRDLLNSFYRGVKSAQPGAKVIGPATAPYGDRPGGERTPPYTFLRELLCLQRRTLTPMRCPTRARFDILSHHPINPVDGPGGAAANPLDISTPDVHRLIDLVRRAERRGTVLPGSVTRPIWGTEMWWETRPDSLYGVSLPEQARRIALSEMLLWRQGVSVAIFMPLMDQPYSPDYPSLQSGLYFQSGKPKLPGIRAFRFPLVVERRGSSTTVWAKPPRRGTVRIQRRVGGRWQTVHSLRVWRDVPFQIRLALPGDPALRAVVSGVATTPSR